MNVAVYLTLATRSQRQYSLRKSVVQWSNVLTIVSFFPMLFVLNHGFFVGYYYYLLLLAHTHTHHI